MSSGNHDCKFYTRKSLLHVELGLPDVNLEAGFPQPLKHLADVSLIVLQVIIVDKDVIQVNGTELP